MSPPRGGRSTPTSTASRTPRTAQLTDLNVPLNRLRRQQHVPLQLADQRRQSRAGLVLREHRRLEQHGRPARRRLRRGGECRRRRADDHHSDHRLHRDSSGSTGASWPATPSPSTARRPATTRSGSPMPATACAPATAPTSPGMRRPTPTSPNKQPAPTGLDRASRHAVGPCRQRRRSLLHPRQRAVALALDAS